MTTPGGDGEPRLVIEGVEVRRTEARVFFRWQWRVRWNDGRRRPWQTGYAFTRAGAEQSADKEALRLVAAAERRSGDGWEPVGAVRVR